MSTKLQIFALIFAFAQSAKCVNNGRDNCSSPAQFLMDKENFSLDATASEWHQMLADNKMLDDSDLPHYVVPEISDYERGKGMISSADHNAMQVTNKSH